MRKPNKKQEEETTTENNPFDNWYFWLSLLTADFGFFCNEQQANCKTGKQPLQLKQEE